MKVRSSFPELLDSIQVSAMDIFAKIDHNNKYSHEVL
jgi:hypothetical protein